MGELNDTKGLLENQIPIWIANYEDLQEMPLELSADIDQLLETQTMSPDIKEIREFLADRYNVMQDEIDRLKMASANGSKVLLVK
ncbi:hypothetical protein LCGC14_2000620 [marine sediment metagenome]|uniref:Uncharacterized protein n=1 Tax=marine sediment metagenome TaxID=412755 RepID=A0A0F9HGS9_9ZZZZ